MKQLPAFVVERKAKITDADADICGIFFLH